MTSSTSTYDVIIIGAGSTGLYSAKRLASNSFKVLIIEAKDEIGKDIICAGIISKRAFDEYDLNKNSVLTEINEIKFISPAGNWMIYKHPETLSYVVDRELFNKNLAEEAIAAGAELILDTYIYDITQEKDHLTLFARNKDKGEMRFLARSAIISTGINYKLNKRLGLGYPSNFVKAWEGEIYCKDIQGTTVLIDNKIALGGFVWAVPINNGVVRIGLMADKEGQQDLNTIMKAIGANDYYLAEPNCIKRKPIAQGIISNTYTDRILIVGEAASQIKTTTGGGIYFGLLCADIACNVLIELLKKNTLSAYHLSEYERKWKAVLGNEILMGYYLRKIFAKLSEDTIEKIFKLIKADGFISDIVSKIDFDWHIDAAINVLKKMGILKCFPHL